MISYILKDTKYSKIQKNLFLVFLLMCWLNFGNYSWLIYTWDGMPNENLFLEVIANLRILIPILTVLYLYQIKVYNRKIKHVIRQNIMLYMLILICFFNIAISEEIIKSVTYSIWLLFSIIVIHLTVYETKSDVDLIKLIKFGSVITVVLVLPSIPFLLEDNERTFFSSKNYYAYAIAIHILSEFYLFTKSKINNHKYLRWGVIILLIMVLFLSGRRAPLLCCLIGCLFYLYKSNKLIFITILLFSSSLIPYVLSSNFFGFKMSDSLTYSRVNRIIESGDNSDSSYDQREFIWGLYLKAFSDSPIIGNGLNTNVSNLSRYYSGELDELSYHNSYLQILVELGLIGFLIFNIYLISVLKQFIRHKQIVLFPILLAILFINWFESNILPGQIFFIFSFSLFALIKKNND